MPDIYYKALGPKAKCIHGKGSWHRSHGARPGKWMPRLTGKLVHYEHGYHVTDLNHLVEHIGPEIYEAEVQEIELRTESKQVCRHARLLRRLRNWNDRTARLFACDCAARALRRIDSPDPRSVNAIRVARLYANGNATEEELAAADNSANAAAWSARDAAWSARAAALSAYYAAWSAYYAASWSARDAAMSARDASWSAELAWQTKRLFEYIDGKRG